MSASVPCSQSSSSASNVALSVSSSSPHTLLSTSSAVSTLLQLPSQRSDPTPTKLHVSRVTPAASSPVHSSPSEFLLCLPFPHTVSSNASNATLAPFFSDEYVTSQPKSSSTRAQCSVSLPSATIPVGSIRVRPTPTVTVSSPSASASSPASTPSSLQLSSSSSSAAMTSSAPFSSPSSSSSYSPPPSSFSSSSSSSSSSVAAGTAVSCAKRTDGAKLSFARAFRTASAPSTSSGTASRVHTHTAGRTSSSLRMRTTTSSPPAASAVSNQSSPCLPSSSMSSSSSSGPPAADRRLVFTHPSSSASMAPASSPLSAASSSLPLSLSLPPIPSRRHSSARSSSSSTSLAAATQVPTLPHTTNTVTGEEEEELVFERRVITQCVVRLRTSTLETHFYDWGAVSSTADSKEDTVEDARRTHCDAFRSGCGAVNPRACFLVSLPATPLHHSSSTLPHPPRCPPPSNSSASDSATSTSGPLCSRAPPRDAPRDIPVSTEVVAASSPKTRHKPLRPPLPPPPPAPAICPRPSAFHSPSEYTRAPPHPHIRTPCAPPPPVLFSRETPLPPVFGVHMRSVTASVPSDADTTTLVELVMPSCSPAPAMDGSPEERCYYSSEPVGVDSSNLVAPRLSETCHVGTPQVVRFDPASVRRPNTNAAHAGSALPSGVEKPVKQWVFSFFPVIVPALFSSSFFADAAAYLFFLSFFLVLPF